MSLFNGQPKVVVRGQPLAGGWLNYVGVVLCASGIMTLVRSQDVGMALVSLPLGLTLLTYTLALWLQEVRIYDDGFEWRRLGRTRRVLWSEVRSHHLVQERTQMGGSRARLAVLLIDGREHRLTHLAQPEDVERFLHTHCKGGEL